MREPRQVALHDKTALVTGASSGIGKAIALRLMAGGAKVCMAGRHEDSLQEVAVLAGVSSDQAMCYEVDLSIADDVVEFVNHVGQDAGAIDILVHSAGSIHNGRIEDTSVTYLDEQYRLNVRAPYVITQALLPSLKKSHGQIVFVNSSIVSYPRQGQAQYSATKHALWAIADCLRAEVNSEGVRVISVFPGRTATPMQSAIYEREGKVYTPELLMQPEDVAESVVSALCLPHTAEVTDLHIRPFTKSH